MSEPTPTVPGRRLARSVGVQWAILVVGSALLLAALRVLGLPGSWMIGPMLAGVVVGVNGGTIRVPPAAYLLAQSLVGCMVAGQITRPVVRSFAREWPVFLAAILATLVASSALGWLLNRRRLLPGTTAIWGLSPGAASTMMLMSEDHGGDPRLVAFMQYFRVLCVASLASVVARFAVGVPGAARPEPPLFSPIELIPFLETLALAAAGILFSRRLRIPSGTLMVPMVLGSTLQLAGVIRIDLPRWLLLILFTVLGWGVGLRFTRAGLAHAARSFPWILASIAILIAFCGLVAWTLHVVLGTDLLTAYLATSPGGLDAAAAIAATAAADFSFVMGLQTMRLILVMSLGPSLARLVARLSPPSAPIHDLDRPAR